MANDDETVIVARCENAIDANIIKGLLETNGIIAGVMEDSTSKALMMTTVNVLVMRHDLERAQAILDLQDE